MTHSYCPSASRFRSPPPHHRTTIGGMEASQKASSVTILIRLAACAMIGVGIMTVFMGVFSSGGSGTMCLAGVLVFGLAALLLAANPRMSVERPNRMVSQDGNLCPMCGANTDTNQRRCVSCGENLAGSDAAAE